MYIYIYKPTIYINNIQIDNIYIYISIPYLHTYYFQLKYITSQIKAITDPRQPLNS